MIDSDISKNSLLPASVFASGPDFLQHPDGVTADDLGDILIAVVVLYQPADNVPAGFGGVLQILHIGDLFILRTGLGGSGDGQCLCKGMMHAHMIAVQAIHTKAHMVAMPTMFFTYSKCSIKLSRSWVILVLDIVVWGAASMPTTPPLAATA